MKNLFCLAVISPCSVAFAASLLAQEVDNTLTLPDARPGECYAKIITPARYETSSEEVLVREASDRVETIPAVYRSRDENVLVREQSRRFTAVEAQFTEVEERVETRAADLIWTRRPGDVTQPASPDALDGLRAAGIEPDEVEAGQCFREYQTQAEYETETLDILVREASERVIVTDAVYETVTERVLVKPASSKIIDVPAIYRVETETVEVEPARSVWKQGRGLVERIDNATGEILCLVEVPARFEEVSRTILERPATTRRVTVPPVFETHSVQRVVTPGGERREQIPADYRQVTRHRKVADSGFLWLPASEDARGRGTPSGRELCRIEQPAEYELVKRLKISEPARAEVDIIAAQYQTVPVAQLASAAGVQRVVVPERTRTVTSRVQLEPSRLEWRKVLCETNVTPTLVTGLQRALTREGFEPGPIDGRLGPGTMRAVKAFQLENELDRGGLTYETLQRLEVDG